MNEELPLDLLTPAPYNPRLISAHDFEALKKSILTFGDLSGITKNLHTGNLVGGHQRLEAFKQTTAPKIVITERFPEATRSGTMAHGFVLIEGERFSYREVAWPLEFEKAANIAANRIQGEFQTDQLAEVMASLNAELQGLTGHTQAEIDKLLDVVGELPEADREPDAEPKRCESCGQVLPE
jgi:hypothetical protein